MQVMSETMRTLLGRLIEATHAPRGLHNLKSLLQYLHSGQHSAAGCKRPP